MLEPVLLQMQMTAENFFCVGEKTNLWQILLPMIDP